MRVIRWHERVGGLDLGFGFWVWVWVGIVRLWEGVGGLLVLNEDLTSLEVSIFKKDFG